MLASLRVDNASSIFNTVVYFLKQKSNKHTDDIPVWHFSQDHHGSTSF